MNQPECGGSSFCYKNNGFAFFQRELLFDGAVELHKIISGSNDFVAFAVGTLVFSIHLLAAVPKVIGIIMYFASILLIRNLCPIRFFFDLIFHTDLKENRNVF